MPIPHIVLANLRAMVHRGSVRVRRVTAVLILVGVVLVGFARRRTRSSSTRRTPDSVLPGVTVDGVRVAGKKDVAALDEITRTRNRARTDTDPRPRRRPRTSPSSRRSSASRSTSTRPSTAARRGGPGAATRSRSWRDTVMRRFRPDDVPLVVHYDRARSKACSTAGRRASTHGLVEGDLRFEGTTVIPVEPKSGHRAPARRGAAPRCRTRSSTPTAPRRSSSRSARSTPRVDQAEVERPRPAPGTSSPRASSSTPDRRRLVLAPAQLAADARHAHRRRTRSTSRSTRQSCTSHSGRSSTATSSRRSTRRSRSARPTRCRSCRRATAMVVDLDAVAARHPRAASA